MEPRHAPTFVFVPVLAPLWVVSGVMGQGTSQPAPTTPPASTAPAAPGGAAAVPAPTIPSEPLAAVAAYYATIARADRIAVTVTTSDGKSARATIVVRSDPGDERALPRRHPSVRLTLGPLEAHVRERRLVAINRGNDELAFVRDSSIPFTAEAVRGILPPVPVPHLGWALDHTPNPHPYGLAAQVNAPVGATQKFNTPDGELTLEIDAKTGHPKSMTLAREDSTRIQLDFTAIDPGDPETWKIQLGTRTAVASLDKLTPKGKPIAGEGARTPQMSLLDQSLAPVSLPDLVREAAAAKPNFAPWAWVIVFPCPADASALDTRVIEDMDAAMNTAAIAWGLPDPPPRPAIVLFVGTMPLGNIDPDAIAKRYAQVHDLVIRRQDEVPVRVVFSPQGKDLTESLLPSAKVVGAVVDVSGKLRGVASLDAGFHDGKGSEQTIRTLLSAPLKAPAASPTQPPATSTPSTPTTKTPEPGGSGVAPK